MKRFFLFLAAALPVLVLYLANRIRSGLWYDEAIEYYFSRVLSGSVPGGLGTEGMYERITMTYQPPLYNALMHLWLRLFDSEGGFRLAGVLTTFLGAGGLWLAFCQFDGLCLCRSGDPPGRSSLQGGTLSEDSYPSGRNPAGDIPRNMGTLVFGGSRDNRRGQAGILPALGAVTYLLTTGVSYYAMECGEYNLMLCGLCWTLWFFLRSLARPSRGSLAGFFLWGSLAVYSQYGAAFLVGALYLSLLFRGLRTGDRQILRWMGIGTAGTGVAAVLPLLYFFLIPQLSQQGTTAISHYPAFYAANPVLDFLRALYLTAYWDFLGNGYPGSLGGIPLSVLALPLLLFAFCCVLWCLRKCWGGLRIPTAMARAAKQRNHRLSFMVSPEKDLAWESAIPPETDRRGMLFRYLLLASMLSFVTFYLAVLCSFYGYNSWSPALGSENFGGRYGLFFLPLWVLVLGCGVQFVIGRSRGAVSKECVSEGSISGRAASLLFLAFALYAFLGIRVICVNWVKDDLREVCTIWCAQEGFREKTLVHQWSEPCFFYYFQHTSGYEEALAAKVTVADPWIREVTYQNIDHVGFDASEVMDQEPMSFS